MLLKRPRVVLAVVVLLSLAMVYVADRYAGYDVGPDSIVDPGSSTYLHEAQFEGTFGADPLLVLVSGDVVKIFAGNGLIQLVNLEGNLVLPKNTALGVQAITGPASLAAVTAAEITGIGAYQLQQAQLKAQQDAIAAAKAAGKSDADAQADGQAAAQKAASDYLDNAIKTFPELASIGIPSETNPAWVSGIFLKDQKPKPKFVAIVPDAQHILITARLKPSTGEIAVNQIAASTRDALKKAPIPGASVILSGAPMLEAAAARALRQALVAGMAIGLLSMILLLAFVRRRMASLRLRLVPVVAGLVTVLLLGGIVTLGGLGVARLRNLPAFDNGTWQSILTTFAFALNPATLAAFPIVLGLGVDYAVQFMVRYRQEVLAAPSTAWDVTRKGAGRATRRAAICTGAGLLALISSGLPMVRQFGVVMILGAAIAWAVARLMVLGVVRAWPALAGAEAVTRPAVAQTEEDITLFGLGGAPVPAGVAGPPGEGGSPGVLTRVVRASRQRSTAVLAGALLVAAVGWLAFPFSQYETDPERLVSPNLPAFQDLQKVRQATGYSGELDFVLSGPDVTSTAALEWARNLNSTAQRDSSGRFKPIASLAQFFGDVTGSTTIDAAQVKRLLVLMPAFLTDSLVSPDHSLARIAFGINLAPVAQQQQDIERILADVEPPAGYTYYAAGLNYIGVKGLETLQSGQVLLNGLGAVFVLVVLLAIYRHRRTALLAWAPTLLVAGWSTAILFALRIPLTPMTAVLGALVVAFGTEFAILWLERYREAVGAGAAPGSDAAEAASQTAGPGIVLSGAALILGFLALSVSGPTGIRNLGFDLPMVRDFGLVAAMDMALAIGAVLVVLPVLVLRFGLGEPAAAIEPRVPERAVSAPTSSWGARARPCWGCSWPSVRPSGWCSQPRRAPPPRRACRR